MPVRTWSAGEIMVLLSSGKSARQSINAAKSWNFRMIQRLRFFPLVLFALLVPLSLITPAAMSQNPLTGPVSGDEAPEAAAEPTSLPEIERRREELRKDQATIEVAAQQSTTAPTSPVGRHLARSQEKLE
jgi:hypothetical protein